MRILMPTIWFHRGASYVTKTLRNILTDLGHEVFIFARTGGVYGVPKLETDNEWNVPNLITHPTYKIEPDDLVDCIRKNHIDIVIYNEEYDMDMVYKVKKATGIKTITYLDYYKYEWKDIMGDIYDNIWCSSKRSYNIAKEIKTKVSYIGWGIDTDLFSPDKLSNFKKFTYFHNAGYYGLNFRKGTPYVIWTFNEACNYNLDITLLVHAQKEYDVLPQEIVEIIKNNNRIEFRIETVPHPGFYSEALWYLGPSSMEGLGLTIPEALATGLPVITTNAPPMNEFVRDGYNGHLISVANYKKRNDNIAFEEAVIDQQSFLEKMLDLGNRVEMSKNARESIVNNYTMEHLKQRVNGAING